MGQVLLYPFYGTNEVDAIVLVFFDAGSDRKDIDVEDDVLWREADGGQEIVGTTGNGNLAFVGCGLSFLVESHHNNSGSQSAQFCGFGQEVLFACFETYGVDDAFALCVLQSGKYCRPVAAVYHQDSLAHGRFSADVSAEGLHFLLAVEHGIVHIDVDDSCSAFYLLTGNSECLVVLFLSDESCETP